MRYQVAVLPFIRTETQHFGFTPHEAVLLELCVCESARTGLMAIDAKLHFQDVCRITVRTPSSDVFTTHATPLEIFALVEDLA